MLAADAAVEQLSTEAAHVDCLLDLSLKIIAPVSAVTSGKTAVRATSTEEREEDILEAVVENLTSTTLDCACSMPRWCFRFERAPFRYEQLSTFSVSGHYS